MSKYLSFACYYKSLALTSQHSLLKYNNFTDTFAQYLQGIYVQYCCCCYLVTSSSSSLFCRHVYLVSSCDRRRSSRDYCYYISWVLIPCLYIPQAGGSLIISCLSENIIYILISTRFYWHYFDL